MPNQLHAQGSDQGLTLKAYRGDRSAFLAFDLDAHLTKDLAGFAVEVTDPAGQKSFLQNRLSYDQGLNADTRPEDRAFTPSNLAPFQKFSWFHVPDAPVPGAYQYRATAMYRRAGQAKPEPGPSASVSLEIVPQAGLFQVGFTRGAMSSQTYLEKFCEDVTYAPSPKSLDYDYGKYAEKYAWLGFHARTLMMEFIDACVADPRSTLDVFAYDIDEPYVVRQLQAMGGRLRAVLDNAELHTKPGAMEIEVLRRLKASAGEHQVVTGHFKRFAHDKVLIRKVDGKPHSVLTGSANFSIRGLYVQANSVLRIEDPDVAARYEDAFQASFQSMSGFAKAPVAGQWWDFTKPGLPRFGVAFSPHHTGELSLDRVCGAIAESKSSVIYAVMELDGSGIVMKELQCLTGRDDVFSYGVTQHSKGINLYRPGSKNGVLVDFAAIQKHAPWPFCEEVTGGMGQVIHHKFVVCDFNDADPVVFCGSSNLAEGGEQENGDNLLAIYDRPVVQAYAVEGMRLVDHYAFRDQLQGATAAQPLMLQGPALPKGTAPWWQRYYDPKDLASVERTLFSR